MRPSVQPTIYNALLTTFAKKNKVPMEPPNSGPSTLLIMTIREKLRENLVEKSIS